MLVEVMVRDRVKLSLSCDVMIIILCHVSLEVMVRDRVMTSNVMIIILCHQVMVIGST